MTLNERWKLSTERTERFLSDRLCSLTASEEPQKDLFDAMRYSLLAGGKRLRPFLVREFCRVCGGTEENADHAAAAIEMIHTYSLIHDDLPCMDNDDYRRGKATNHKVYGEALAVLAGDALLTDAFRVLSESKNDPAVCAECVSVLAREAGSCGMVGGQVLDIEAETRTCTDEEVIAIQSRKTGGLIRAACRMGVLCGKGTEKQMDAATRYADAVGLAFQIEDDILDVVGNAQKLGKSVGTDGAKNTFVRLYGIERCKELVKEQTALAIDALGAFSQADSLKELALALSERDF